MLFERVGRPGVGLSVCMWCCTFAVRECPWCDAGLGGSGGNGSGRAVATRSSDELALVAGPMGPPGVFGPSVRKFDAVNCARACATPPDPELELWLEPCALLLMTSHVLCFSRLVSFARCAPFAARSDCLMSSEGAPPAGISAILGLEDADGLGGFTGCCGCRGGGNIVRFVSPRGGRGGLRGSNGGDCDLSGGGAGEWEVRRRKGFDGDSGAVFTLKERPRPVERPSRIGLASSSATAELDARAAATMAGAKFGSGGWAVPEV